MVDICYANLNEKSNSHKNVQVNWCNLIMIIKPKTDVDKKKKKLYSGRDFFLSLSLCACLSIMMNRFQDVLLSKPKVKYEDMFLMIGHIASPVACEAKEMTLQTAEALIVTAIRQCTSQFD